MKRAIRLTAALPGILLLAASQTVTASAAEQETGWQIISGKRYYVQEDGSYAAGTVTLDGVTYVFAPNGAQQLGWQTVDGTRRYYGRDGAPQLGWITWRGADYYIDPEQGKLTGSAETPDGLCQFDAYGVAQTGWFRSEAGKWSYAGTRGKVAVGETEIEGTPYFFDETGALMGGWQTAKDGITRRYDAETAKTVTGWITEADKTWYADPVTGRLTGRQEIGGQQYLFDADGLMQTGWHTDAAGTYYFGSDGAAVTGLLTDGGKTYAFGENGLMLHGFYEADGARYFLGADGAALTGWIEQENQRYYADETGKLLTGWQTVDDTEYLFAADGMQCTGIVQTEDGSTFILAENGQRFSGWYRTADGAAYYCAEPGVPAVGWLAVDGHTYHFAENGVMTVSGEADGFTIDENGFAKSENAVKTDAILQTAGSTPQSIFTYCVTNYRYSRMEKTRTYDQLKGSAWETIIAYTMKNRRGVCYYLAATFDYFCQRMGFTTRLVHATHKTGDHYWVQVKVGNAWQNYDPTYKSRSNISWSKIIKLGEYTVYGFISIRYDDRGAYLDETYTEDYMPYKS